MNLKILKEPVKVISNTFKHKGELSDFSFSVEDLFMNDRSKDEVGIMKNNISITHNRAHSGGSPSPLNLNGPTTPRTK